MPIKLDEKAQEGSTFGVVVEFFELQSDGTPSETPATPNSGLTWTLKDGKGNTVNNKYRIPIAAAQSVTVVLKGDDLALSSGYPEKRKLTFDGTYDSALGDDLPIRHELWFQVENLEDTPPLGEE